MGELIHFTITTRNRYISNMNRFVIACIFMAFAAAAASEDTYKERNLFTEPPRSAQTDFLETMMHDGEVPEHFFDTPVAAKGNAKKDVAPCMTRSLSCMSHWSKKKSKPHRCMTRSLSSMPLCSKKQQNPKGSASRTG